MSLEKQGLRFQIHLPLIFNLDPLKTVLGIDVAEVLSPFLDGKVTKSLRHRVIPLIIHNGETIVVALGEVGIVAFRINRGRLTLYLPPAWASGFEDHTSAALRGPRFDGEIDGAECVAWALSIQSGQHVAVKVPGLGEIKFVMV